MSKASQHKMVLRSVLNIRYREIQSETQIFICARIPHKIPSDNNDLQLTVHIFSNTILCRKCEYYLRCSLQMNILIQPNDSLVLISYLRLLRSRSSVSKSKRGCGVSLGPWDCNTDELDDMTVVWPEGWMVLNWNCGPIQRRLWGPVCVTISTWNRLRTMI